MDVVGVSTGFVAGDRSRILRFDAQVPAMQPSQQTRASKQAFRISGDIARIDLEADIDVTANLHDLEGRRVATLFRGRLASGSHVLPAPRVRAPGIYLLRLRIGDVLRSSVWILH